MDLKYILLIHVNIRYTYVNHHSHKINKSILDLKAHFIVFEYLLNCDCVVNVVCVFSKFEGLNATVSPCLQADLS